MNTKLLKRGKKVCRVSKKNGKRFPHSYSEIRITTLLEKEIGVKNTIRIVQFYPLRYLPECMQKKLFGKHQKGRHKSF